MRKSLSGLWAIIIIFITIIIPFYGLTALKPLKASETPIQNVNRQKRSSNFEVREQDFINTMFLRSSFFENWSDTNYFVNPTLKTSKSLTYNENWYLDFLKDSYASGIVFDKPSEQFLEVYQNWDNYVKQYKLDRFYSVDKKFFLKDLTNFMYTYFEKYDGTGKARKMQQSIKNLEQVKFNEDKWKLIDYPTSKNIIHNLFKNPDNKWYIVNLFTVQEGNIIRKFKFTNEIKLIKKSDYDEFTWEYKFKDYEGLPNELFGYYRYIYQWNGINEPLLPKIDNSGKITDWESGDEWSFLFNIFDEVIKENIRVEQGGSANYEKLDVDGTQRIIFDFEIIDELDEKKKVVYRMILTINKEQIIRAGNLTLIHYVNDQYDTDKLNFSFDFTQSRLIDKNGKALWNFRIENYLYQQQNKIIMEELNGLIDINAFLKQFFSNALMPMFTNRGAFMEASYLDFLTYDTVVVNFLGLKADNFLSVVNLENLNSEQEKINYKLKWKNILNSSFKIMNDFYKNYLRVMFDLEGETYIQGYSKKFGLLVINGFKIFPKYFYFSDKYKNLDVKIYSSHANKFYQTKYGRVFNFDYSVFNNFKVDSTSDYLFYDRTVTYPLRVKDLSIQKVGYGVFELQAQKENEFYHYYDFNFGIYNWKDLTSLVDKPIGQWWNEQIENCKWYDMVCHIKNGSIWIVNNIPGIKQANELASGVGKLFQTTYNFFAQTFEIWKFNLDFYIVITNTFLLIIFMKFIRMF
ncbi:spiroplasma phage ORF1-like family protein [Spiroplasma endosymbiont of Polydrusus pterygomalis]|uniref:spiroplasma phage ORF1-like family protein n=1 Tax=Spiroplasma endosymbiont of Polydrusus pterygomalis TaxID=3139327 RepID=UPI003CCA83B7